MKYKDKYGVLHIPISQNEFILDVYAVDAVPETEDEDPDEALEGFIFDTVEQLEECLTHTYKELTNFDELMEEINSFKKGKYE